MPILSCVILARPTKSIVKYLQAVGRVMRPCDGKADALILDHAGCVPEHGFPSDHRDFGLHDSFPNSKAATKRCKECRAMLPASARRCKACGFVFERQASRENDVPAVNSDVELQLVLPSDSGFEAEQAANSDRTVAAPRFPCSMCGHQEARVNRMIGTFTWEMKCRRCQRIFYETNKQAAQAADLPSQCREYARLESIRIRKGYKPGWTGFKFRDLFGQWPTNDVKQVAQASA